jgi:phage recombination protein Bet
MNELTVRNNSMVKSEKIEFTDEQKQLIKQQIAPKATDSELKLFLYQCQRSGLDPLTRQIYCIHRWTKDGDKMTVQTSIDGFRVIAERSGVYAGQSEPEFLEDNGKLKCCKITVRKFSPNGQIYDAAVGVAYWDEYVQLTKDNKPSGLWAKMPHTMLSKVAEALALRKAFPQDLSGLYTSDEMQQADVTTEPAIVEKGDVIDVSDKALLFMLLNSSTLEAGTEAYENAWKSIDTCPSYKKYEALKARLEDLQPSIDQIPNPSQKDINNHVKKIA